MKKAYTLWVVLSLLGSLSAIAWDIPEDKLQLGPPPQAGSLGEERDYEELFRYQAERTAKECQEADLQTYPSMKVFFGPQVGLLNETQFNQVEAFGKALLKQMGRASRIYKHEYERVRPYNNDARIHPCIQKPVGQTSYPSSHAAMGWILGEALAEVYPDQADELKNQGMRIGELRVLGGVHHPSDVEAGRNLAKQVYQLLKKDAEFLEEIGELRGH